jgi:hypothetical protein
LRPISFHCESTTCEGLGAGRGVALVVRMTDTEAPNAIPRASTPGSTFFIFSLLDFAALRAPP